MRKLVLAVSMMFWCLVSTSRDFVGNVSVPKKVDLTTASLLKKSHVQSLAFIENKGQITDQHNKPRRDIQFKIAAAPGLNIFIGDGAIHYQFSKPDKEARPPAKEEMIKPGYIPEYTTYSMYRMDVKLINANKHAQVVTEEKQGYYENYFTGNCRTNGAIGHAFNRITYKEVYPNIDWVLYVSKGQMKHEFVVREGGKVSDIKLKFGGATSVKIDNNGNLVANTPQGVITENAPYTYQMNGRKIASGFKIDGDVLSYTIGEYTGDLVIDPSLLWATYYGGVTDDYGEGVAKDGAGNVFMIGLTNSSSSIATSGAYQTAFGGGGYDVFLAKFNSLGLRQWATYYGGGGQDIPYGIATDGAGDIYVTGRTFSTSGISTLGAYHTAHGGGTDAFLAKFSNSGGILWATYFGSSNHDDAFGVATDVSGNVYISGYTRSTSAISTSASYQTIYGGGGKDGYLAKFNSLGAIQWATYYGGSNDDQIDGVATDGTGNVYISGYTESTSAIASSGAFQNTYGGSTDAFLVKFDSSGARHWATYYGGTGYDEGNGVVTDGAGNVYITGFTQSSSAIATSGAYQITFGGVADAFLAKLTSSGVMQWATYYGGTGSDVGAVLVADLAGNIYMSGSTQSTTAIATSGAYQTAHGGGTDDAYLVQFNTSGAVQWATYFGGSNSDGSRGVVTDGSGNVYMTGGTNSTSAIATSGAYQTTFAGGGFGDAFLAKFNFCTPPTAGTISGSSSVSVGTSIALTNTTPGGTWSSGNTSVATLGSTGIVLGVAVGTVTISYTITNSCGSATATKSVTVSVAPCSSWNPVDSAGFSSGSVFAPTMALNGGSIPYVAYSDNAYASKATVMKFNGTSWLPVGTAGFSIGGTQYTSIAIDGGGTPYVVFQDVVNSYKATVMKYNGSSWISVGSPGFSTAQAYLPVIITDTTGTPYVAYRDDGDSSKGVIMMYNGSTWIPLGGTAFSSAQANWISMAIDNSGIMYVAYMDISLGNRITVKKYNGSSWVTVGTAGFSASVAQFISIAVNASGVPYVAYWDYGNGRKATVMKYNGSSWGAVGTVGFSSGEAIYTSIAIDNSGTPYVAYGDRDNSDKATVMKYNGSSWVLVGTGGFSPGSAGFTSLVMNSGGTPYVSYQDGGNANKVTVMQFSGSISPITGALFTCPSATTPLSDATPGGTWSSSNTSVAIVGSSGTVTGIAAGTSIITYTVSSCNVTATVTVNSLASAGTITGASSVIVGATISLSNATSGVWSSSNPSIATIGSTGIVTGVSPGIDTISYTVTNACGSAVATKVVTVTSSPVTACNTITTIAGNGTAGYSGDGGSATAAKINNPYGIAIDGSGNIFIADYVNDRIRKIDSMGIISTIAGNGTWGYSGDGGPATAAKLAGPIGIALDGSGNIFIAERNNHIIRKVSTSGIISTVAGSGTFSGFSGDGGPATAGQLNYPYGVAVDGSGNIFIADAQNNRIRKVNATGVISTIAGNGISGFSGDGGPATASELFGPNAIVVDGSANIYIGDHNYRYRKIDTSGIINTIAGNGIVGFSGDGGLATAAQLGTPGGTTIDGSGNLYISDYSNHRIRIVNTLGVISTIAGNGISSYSGDGGPASAAGLYGPYGVAVDPLGRIYFSDNGNFRIRKVTPGITVGAITGPSTVTVGTPITLSNTTSGGIWSSSNPSIATVGSTGIVTGISPGIGTISYALTNACGSAVATKVVTVTASSATSCNIITTIAGNGTAGYSGDGGAAASAQMQYPYSVCRDAIGSIYISDGNNNRIRKVDTLGVVTTIAGIGTPGFSGDGGPATNAQLNAPAGINIDNSGNLYVVDRLNQRVRKISTSGTITTFAGNGSSGFSGDSGPATAAQLNNEWSIAVDGGGNVYVTGNGNHRIRKISTSGIITTFAGTGSVGSSGDGGPATAAQLSSPNIRTVDASGNLYITEAGGNRVRKINAAGIINTIGGNGSVGFSGDGGPATAAQLNFPNGGGAVDALGNVYFADQQNNRVRKIDVSGTISTIAGNGTPGYTGDGGAPTAALLNYPIDVIADPSGNLYIADHNNHVVRKIMASLSSVSSISGPSSVCNGSTITLSDSTAGGVWSSLNAAVAIVGSTGIVTGLGLGTTTISYTVTNACGTVSAIKTITVTASPGLISGATSVCTGDTINLSNATPGGTWTSSSTSIATVGSSTGVVTGVATGNVVISYSLGASCQATTTINVLSLPAVPSISGGTSVCIGLTTLLSNSMPGGFWYSTDASKATVSSSGLVTGISGGSVAIVYAVANSCGIGFNSVFVNISAPTPISGVPSACVGASTTLSHSSPGGIWSSSNPLIASVGSASGIVMGIAFGTATITYTMGPGCFATINVSVNASSVSITGTSSLCVTTSAMLGGAPSGGTWSSSHPSIAAVGASGLVTGIASGTATISYTIGGGCYATKTVTVTTTGGPIMGTAGVCRGFTTTLIAPMPGGIWSSASTFFATVGSTTGIVYGASPGTSVITYSVGTGCTSTITVTVRPVPAIMTVTGGGTFCAGSPGVNVGLPGSAVGINYQLYLGGIPVGSPLAGTGSSLSFGLQNISGVYTVRAEDPVTLCQSNMTGGATVTAYPLPIIGVSPSVSICSGGSTMLTASGGISYTWSPGTGLTSTAGSVVNAHPVTTTTYTVTGTNSFGCSNAATVTVTVNPLPTISAGSGVAICNGGTTTLSASGGTSYTWSPATGLSATTGASVIASPGTTRIYTVTGTSSNGCTNRATVTVTVNPLPAISAGSGVSICNGASATLAASGGISYEWSPPAGLSATTGASVTASPIMTTTYTVTGTSSNGCANSATVRVTVNPLPIVSTGPGVSICTGASATLSASGAISYTWSPGTGLSSTAGAIVTAYPVTTTTYTVTGTNSFGCRNTATVAVTVNALPTISAGSGVSICTGGSTTLTASGGISYTWSPATGLSATTGASVIASPSATRTYTVTGISSSGCTNRATVAVTVSSLPGIVACPSVSICNGSSTTLSASGGATYQWSPPAGLSATTGASIVASPTVTTTYTVTGTNGTGCSNRATVTVTVNSQPTISASSGGPICNGSSTTLSASGGVSYIWTPPTGLSSTTGASITASPSVTTTYTVTGTNVSGCTNRATVTVTVNSSPSAISTTGNLCVGNSVTLTNATSGGAWSSSNPTIATIGSSTATVTGLASGTTIISYTLSSGCYSTMVLTVAALPSAISGPGTIYTGATDTYTNATSGGLWSSSNTSIVNIGSVTGIATGVAVGAATLSYTVSSGCRSTLLVSVSATPTVFSVTGGGIYCYGGAAVVIGLSNSQVGVSYQLYRGGTSVGTPVSGTGGAFSFGTFTTAGTYTVIANPSSSSPVTMSGSATVTVISSTMLPPPSDVLGGGTMCAGSPGLPITMPGSAVTVNYQLYRNGILTGSPLPGIGTAMSFGLHTIPGTYTVIATSTVNGCSRNIGLGVNITVFPTPNVYNVTGGGSFCSGVGGVVVGLNNSQSGVNYQLYNGTSTVGSLRPGTGAAFNFSTVTASGTYSVVGIGSYCTANMSGTATVSANPVPTVSGTIYTVAPAGSISLSGSVSGGLWTSSNTGVATIGTSSGIVTGVALGSSTISYTLPTGCRGTRVIYVTPTGHRGISDDSATSALFARRVYVRPNPNSGTFWVNGDFRGETEATLEVFNMLGQKIYSRVVRLEDGKLDEEILLENIANGTYLLNVSSATYRDMFQIVVTR